MGHKIACFLYGSQNYNLATPESDEDYKWIEFPSAEDLFKEKTLNRQVTENYSVWDVRNFLKYLMKANPNALELLFSIEQDYFDKNFEELLNYIRPRIGSVIRKNWDNFSRAMLGIAWESVRRNQTTPKTVARLTYFWLLWNSLVGDNGIHGMGTNGEMTEETWRDSKREWPREIREFDTNDPNTQEKLEEQVAFISHDWFPDNWHIDLQPQDEEIYEEIQQKVLNYFEVSLTCC